MGGAEEGGGRVLKERLRHWRRLWALDERIEAGEDEVRDLEELLAGARRRLEGRASDAAFRTLLEREVAAVHGVGPTLAERIATHPLMRHPSAFRASVEKVEGVGPKKKERLLEWERRSRARHRELTEASLDEGGVDAELEATIGRLESELEEARAALRRLRERRNELARRGPDSGDRNRVVLDTNVFVGAGFNPGSASAALLRAVEDGRLRMPWSDATRAEVERILRKIPPLAWSDVEGLFREEDHVEGEPDPGGLEWIPDPDDRPFAALARSAEAALVSADDDLLGGRERAGFPVWTPGEAKDRLLE